MLKNFLLLQKTDKNPDEAEITLAHREIILRKKFLKKLYTDWYKKVLEKTHGIPKGKIIEIGSGGGFIKELYPDVITSDILPLNHCDLVLSATDLPFKDKELSAIIMIDVLHHIPDCSGFFNEAGRTLKKGGKIIMLEPANTIWSRFIFKNFHHEQFDEETKSWSFSSSGPLSGANIALPWIIFERDKDKFHEKFPGLKLINIHYHTPFSYLLSGGVSYRAFVPFWSYTAVTAFEKLILRFSKQISMFQTIEVIKEHSFVS